MGVETKNIENTHKRKKNCLGRGVRWRACIGMAGRGLPIRAGPAVLSWLSCPSSWQRVSRDL